MTDKEIYEKAINTYGLPAQIDQLHEEIGELMQAINKIKRAGGVKPNCIFKPHRSSTQKYTLAYHELCGEVVDVKIMLEQLESVLCADTMALIRERKLERLKNNLEKIK